MYKKKRLAYKIVKGGSKLAAMDEESIELNNDDDKDTGDKDCMAAMVECVGSCVPTENVSIMGSVVPNPLLSIENCEVSKKDGTAKAVHQENTCLAESLAIKNLPFMKTSPIWEKIEAMEVFRNMPQQPNFSKFQHHVPELCGGKALGLMLSFAILADSIKRLNIHDDDALFQEKMKGLPLLEVDGFDVRHLRSQVETLLHIRNGHARLAGAIKDLKKKISHKETVDRHLGTQIVTLNMTAHQLELQAYLFRSIMQSAISEKMNYASEMVMLKTEADRLKRSYLSTEEHFSSAAAALW